MAIGIMRFILVLQDAKFGRLLFRAPQGDFPPSASTRAVTAVAQPEPGDSTALPPRQSRIPPPHMQTRIRGDATAARCLILPLVLSLVNVHVALRHMKYK